MIDPMTACYACMEAQLGLGSWCHSCGTKWNVFKTLESGDRIGFAVTPGQAIGTVFLVAAAGWTLIFSLVAWVL